MRKIEKPAIPVCLFVVYILWITGSAGSPEADVSEACYQCLCNAATKCDLAHECTGGYCGPFNISRIFWIESGKIVLPGDDADKSGAWKDCAKSYECSKLIVAGYLEKFAQDCNADGVIDCMDYVMITYNGGYGCSRPLDRDDKGRLWLKRYQDCKL